MCHCVPLEVTVCQFNYSNLNEHSEQAVVVEDGADIEHRNAYLQGANELNGLL